jgi:eukaryotic-like serine/threonine-protein kinase
VPQKLEDYFALPEVSPHGYWKKLSNRFPGMIRQMRQNTRVGLEDNQAIINTVLPKSAAHNLVLGTELTMATVPGSAATATVVATTNKQVPQSMEEALQNLTRFFPR